MDADTNSATSGKPVKYTWMTRQGWLCGCYGGGHA